MRNFCQPGENLTIPAPAAVTSGDPVIVGEIVGVAVHSAESGADVSISTVGVFELPKGTSTFALGDPVYWDGTAATSTSTGNDKIGVAVAEAALAETATVRVKVG